MAVGNDKKRNGLDTRRREMCNTRRGTVQDVRMSTTRSNEMVDDSVV